LQTQPFDFAHIDHFVGVFPWPFWSQWRTPWPLRSQTFLKNLKTSRAKGGCRSTC
jgi:hypothetical protein